MPGFWRRGNYPIVHGSWVRRSGYQKTIMNQNYSFKKKDISWSKESSHMISEQPYSVILKILCLFEMLATYAQFKTIALKTLTDWKPDHKSIWESAHCFFWRCGVHPWICAISAGNNVYSSESGILPGTLIPLNSSAIKKLSAGGERWVAYWTHRNIATYW